MLQSWRFENKKYIVNAYKIVRLPALPSNLQQEVPSFSLATLNTQNISTTIGCISLKFGTHIHVTLRINSNNFDDPLIFHLVSLSGQRFCKSMTFPSASTGLWLGLLEIVSMLMLAYNSKPIYSLTEPLYCVHLSFQHVYIITLARHKTCRAWELHGNWINQSMLFHSTFETTRGQILWPDCFYLALFHPVIVLLLPGCGFAILSLSVLPSMLQYVMSVRSVKETLLVHSLILQGFFGYRCLGAMFNCDRSAWLKSRAIEFRCLDASY